MSVFEIAMLVCFGAAWPANIVKSIKSKSVSGKSVLFLYVISLGYVFGIVHKIVYNYDFVVFLYGLNLSMVLIDLGLFYRNKKLYQ
jgi:hypothetical protein